MPVRRPPKHDFFRVHPHEDYRRDFAVVEIRGDRNDESYLLTNEMAHQLTGEYAMATAHVVINRQGDLSIWLVKQPVEGRQNDWHDSAREAASIAMRFWIRLNANMAAGRYDVLRAIGELEEPVWPPQSFAEILRIAFRDHIVDSPNHPLVKRLRGVE
jgi:hypothetical protein